MVVARAAPRKVQEAGGAGNPSGTSERTAASRRAAAEARPRPTSGSIPRLRWVEDTSTCRTSGEARPMQARQDTMPPRGLAGHGAAQAPPDQADAASAGGRQPLDLRRQTRGVAFRPTLVDPGLPVLRVVPEETQEAAQRSHRGWRSLPPRDEHDGPAVAPGSPHEQWRRGDQPGELEAGSPLAEQPATGRSGGCRRRRRFDVLPPHLAPEQRDAAPETPVGMGELMRTPCFGWPVPPDAIAARSSPNTALTWSTCRAESRGTPQKGAGA